MESMFNSTQLNSSLESSQGEKKQKRRSRMANSARAITNALSIYPVKNNSWNKPKEYQVTLQGFITPPIPHH